MKLYCDPVSTTSRPVLMFIVEQGLEVEIVHIDLLSNAHQDPAYLALNPNGLVPFLVDEDLAIGESAAILKYLANVSDSTAYPEDLAAQAIVDAAMSWFSMQFHEYFCLFTCYPHMGVPQGLPPELSQALVAYGREKVPRWLKVLDEHMLAGRPYVCGDHVTIADYYGLSFTLLGALADFDFGPYPNIQAWVARMQARDSYAATFATFNQLVAFVRSQPRAA